MRRTGQGFPPERTYRSVRAGKSPRLHHYQNFEPYFKRDLDLYYTLYYNWFVQTILRTYRLPADLAGYLKARAEERETSETTVLVEALRKILEKEDQWQKDLAAMASDADYQK